MPALASRRAALRALHGQGRLVVPSPWDAGMAHDLARAAPFAALDTLLRDEARP